MDKKNGQQRNWTETAKVVLNFLFFIAVVAVNVILFPLIDIGPARLEKMMPNLLSPSGLMKLEKMVIPYENYPHIFIPAPMTFFIWIAVYIMLFYFSVNQIILYARKKDIDKTVDTISWWYILASIVSIMWYLTWHFRMDLYSMLLMCGLLAVLVIIYRNLHTRNLHFTVQENLFIRLPFSLYTGWVSVTTLVNLAFYLRGVHWHYFGLPQQIWAILGMGLLAAASVFLLLRFRDYGYAAAVLWFFAGILVARYSAPVSTGSIIIAVWICIAVIAVGIIVSFRPRRENVRT